MNRRFIRREFIYVTAIPMAGESGQNVFETEIVKALHEVAPLYDNLSVPVFCPHMHDTASNLPAEPSVCALLLRSKTYWQYLRFQWRLFKAMGLYLWKHRRSQIVVFMRYHDSMVSPLILKSLFRYKLIMRTGPVLPNLSIHGKNPSPLVYHFIRITLGEFYRHASKIITVTPRIGQWVVDTYRVSSDKIAVVPNAVDPETFQPKECSRAHWNIPNGASVIGFVGYVYEGKGLDTILHALALLKNRGRDHPDLLVVGDGPDLAKLKSLAQELGIMKRVHWSGHVDRAQVPSAINACDVMLAPFTKREFRRAGSSAIKLWEYLACDKPVFASRDEDHAFIENEKIGVLVEPEDIPEWAEALARVGQWSEGLGGRGRRFVLKEHTYQTAAKKFIELGIFDDPQKAIA